jgi:hypothetical protein
MIHCPSASRSTDPAGDLKTDGRNHMAIGLQIAQDARIIAIHELLFRKHLLNM